MTGERVCELIHDENFANHLNAYKFLAQFVAGKSVLEIGCGTGYGADLLAAVAKEVEATDYSFWAIRYAKSYHLRPNISYRVASAESQYPSGEFDMVFSSEVFEHLQDPRIHLKNAARALAPGGLYFVATPNPENTTEHSRFHVKEWPFAELKRLLEQHFSDVVIVESMNSPASPEQDAARRSRFAAGNCGIDPRQEFSVFGIPVDRSHLSNTHSFFAFAATTIQPPIEKQRGPEEL